VSERAGGMGADADDADVVRRGRDERLSLVEIVEPRGRLSGRAVIDEIVEDLRGVERPAFKDGADRFLAAIPSGNAEEADVPFPHEAARAFGEAERIGSSEARREARRVCDEHVTAADVAELVMDLEDLDPVSAEALEARLDRAAHEGLHPVEIGFLGKAD